MAAERAYCVRRRVHAIDEMLIFASSAEEAKGKARNQEHEGVEREERYGGFESVKRWPEEDH
jgi:hypothetical protein